MGKLKDFRLYLRLNQAEMAEKLSLKSTAYGNYERLTRGKKGIKDEILNKLADLGMNIEWWYGRSDKMINGNHVLVPRETAPMSQLPPGHDPGLKGPQIDSPAAGLPPEILRIMAANAENAVKMADAAKDQAAAAKEQAAAARHNASSLETALRVVDTLSQTISQTRAGPPQEKRGTGT